MVAASRSKKKQAQSRREAVTNEEQEAVPQAAEPKTEQQEVTEDPSSSKPVRIYADGGFHFGRSSSTSLEAFKAASRLCLQPGTEQHCDSIMPVCDTA